MAQNEEASFDPKTTRPEQELEKAGEGNEVRYISLMIASILSIDSVRCLVALGQFDDMFERQK